MCGRKPPPIVRGEVKWAGHSCISVVQKAPLLACCCTEVETASSKFFEQHTWHKIGTRWCVASRLLISRRTRAAVSSTLREVASSCNHSGLAANSVAVDCTSFCKYGMSLPTRERGAGRCCRL